MRIHPKTGEARGGVRTRRRPQASLIVAIIALVAATGGTATALPGSNTVDRNDVAKNAIRSKAIKDGQVTGADLRDGAVTSADIADGAIADADLARGGISGAAIADGTVAGADLAKGAVGGDQIAKGAVGGEQIAAGAITGSHVAATEPFHLVGTPGEPQFYDGGEGDCVWENGIEGATGLAPTGFAKDTFGRVWLQGVAKVTNGPGGDGRCDAREAGESEDGLVFELPPGYRPAHFDLSGLRQLLLLAPDAGAEFTGTTIPPGGVYSALQGNAVLDGLSIRPNDGTAGSSKPAEVSVKSLAALAG
jgi:hypothetical protein